MAQNRVDFPEAGSYHEVQASPQRTLGIPGVRTQRMPHHYTVTLEIAHPLADLFAFLTKPKNFVQLAPLTCIGIAHRAGHPSPRFAAGMEKSVLGHFPAGHSGSGDVRSRKADRRGAENGPFARWCGRRHTIGILNRKINSPAADDAPVSRDHARKPDARVVPASRNRGTPSG